MKSGKIYLTCILCMVLFLTVPSKFVMAEEIADTTESTENEKEDSLYRSSPIAISNFKMNKHSVKPGDKVKYSFTITDIGLEDYVKMYEPNWGDNNYFLNVTLTWVSPKKQKITRTYDWEYGEKSIAISDKIEVNKGMQPGEWHLSRIYFEVTGEEELFVDDNRHSMNEKYPWSPSPLMDFSMADFKVSGTKADNKVPTLDLKSLKLSKAFVKKNEKSTFSVKVKDSSKIAEVECTWFFFKKNNFNKLYACCDSVKSYKMKYDKKKKCYKYSLKLNTSKYRKAQLGGITVRDIHGNEKNYGDYYVCNRKTKKYYNAYKKICVYKK